MKFSQQQSDPSRHLVGIAFVVLLHAFLIYALVTGLAKKVIEVVRAPIETKVIEEIKKPPPQPEIIVPPPPKLEAPPPPFIPPPEVQIATPPTQQPTITATTPTPPPAPVVIAPAPPPILVAAPAAAPPPAPPPVIKAEGPEAAGTACPKQIQPANPLVYDVTGSISVIATIKSGRVVQVEVEKFDVKGLQQATNDRRKLVRAIDDAMKEGYECSSPDGATVSQVFVYRPKK